jgi:RND family efflux transporter MFP subunit
VRRIAVEEGDFVQQGQVLCQLDDSQLQVDLKLAEERLEQSRLQLEKARIAKEKSATQAVNSAADLKRKEKAFAEQLVSAQEVDDIRYRLEEFQHDERSASSGERESRHRVEELEAEIAKAKLAIAHTQVKAPFTGRITERMVELGKTVRNMDTVFRLASFSPLQAEVHLSEQESHRVEPGQTVSVRLGNESTNSVAGKVIRVSPIVDGATGTVKVTVELQPKDEGFKPGAFVRVDIETDSKTDAVLVPRRAIVEDEGETYLFVAEGEKAIRKKVSLGYEWEGDVEVREGISPGQKIVVAGQGSLKEGDKIRVIEG